MVQASHHGWPKWYFIFYLCLELIIILLSATVIFRILHKRKKGGRAAQTGMLRFIDDLVLILCGYHLVQSIIIGPLLAPAFFVPVSIGYSELRHYWWTVAVPLAWFTQFFHTYIASICYSWLVRGHGIDRIQRSLRPALLWIAAAMLLLTFFEVVVIFIDYLIPFYTPHKWSVLAAYVHMVVFAVMASLMCFYYLTTCWTIIKRFRSRERIKKRHRKVVRKFLLINGVILFCYSCWAAFIFLVYRGNGFNNKVGLTLLVGTSLAPISVCVILGNVFQGSPCCVCFKQWRQRRRLARKQQQQEQQIATTIPDPPRFSVRGGGERNLSSVKFLNSFVGRGISSVIGSPPGMMGLGRTNLPADPAALFVTTFNMGPIKDLRDLGGKVSEWVPLGYDVYAIGLQECQCVEEVRAELHAHLGGADAYHMFAAEVGPSTLLYGSIALTVFARSAHVASGAFAAAGAETSRVRNGVNLVVTKASNKGMAGLSFRYHDATLAFITCHFASDSGGRKRLRQRNEDARRTLHDVRLTDDEGFDVSLHHHHTFVFGDVNYRMRLSAHAVVERVVETVRRLESSVWQEKDVAALDATSFELGDDENDERPQRVDEWRVVKLEEYQSPGTDGADNDNEDDDDDAAVRVEEGQQSSVAATSEVEGETESEGGVNFVSRAYMKLFDKSEDRSIVHSFLSQTRSSYVVSPNPLEEDGTKPNGSDADTQTRETERIPSSSRATDSHVEDRSDCPVPGSEDAGGSNMDEERHAEECDASTSGNALRKWLNQHLPFFNSSSKESSGKKSDVFSSFSTSSDTYLVYAGHSHGAASSASLWDWIAEYDELTIEMRAGQIFAGFVEGPLTFPPSFRWRCGGDAGDFTDEARMAAAYVLKKKGDGERVPSYTDRILFHSLPDMQQQLQLVTYQMCDHVRGSDHRPVSAAFRLHLNRQRFGFHTLTLEQAAARTHTQRVVSPEHPIEFAAASTWSVQFFKSQYKPYRFQPSLSLSDLSTARSMRNKSRMSMSVLRGDASTMSLATPTLGSVSSLTMNPSLEKTISTAPPLMAKADWTVSLHFPCALEDPFADTARVEDLEAALALGDAEEEDEQEEEEERARRGDAEDGKRQAGRGRGAQGRPGGAESMRRGHSTTWETLSAAGGITFDVLVVPEVSRHALIRLHDGATEIGSGVVCLRQAFFSGSGGSSGAGWRHRGLAKFLHLNNASRSHQQCVEVLISNQGKAIGLLRMQIKIRRHK